jgi:hypothetical protein
MTLEELNTAFLTGEIDFLNKSFDVDGNEFYFPYDSWLCLNLEQLKKKGTDGVTYCNDNMGHLIFEYSYVKGSIVPNRVYIKTSAELKANAAKWFNNWKNGNNKQLTENVKIMKFGDFIKS